MMGDRRGYFDFNIEVIKVKKKFKEFRRLIVEKTVV